MKKSDLIINRPYNPKQDIGFVHSTWITGLYYGNPWFKHIPRDIYFPNYRKVIHSILENPAVTVSLACLKEEQDVILAYCVFAGSTVHWVYCKEAWRKIGLAKSLLPKEIKAMSHCVAKYQDPFGSFCFSRGLTFPLEDSIKPGVYQAWDGPEGDTYRAGWYNARKIMRPHDVDFNPFQL